MCAQRNKVECMLTSICCHNRFGFFSFGMDPCPPSPMGPGAQPLCCGKAMKLHRLPRRVAPESGQLVITSFHLAPVYVLNLVGQVITCGDLHQTKEIRHINLARAQSTSLAQRASDCAGPEICIRHTSIRRRFRLLCFREGGPPRRERDVQCCRRK